MVYNFMGKFSQDQDKASKCRVKGSDAGPQRGEYYFQVCDILHKEYEIKHEMHISPISHKSDQQ